MKLSRSQTHKTMPKREKYRLTEDQLRLLEASFSQEKKLEPERKFHLAYQLGMPAKQVAIWYQNKRARWKTQNIELDYRKIQQRLDSVLAEKGKLQKEAARLRMELHRVQEILISLNLGAPSTSSDEDDSSQLPADATGGWQMEELYEMLNHNNNNNMFSP
ncbi:hypothetical protein ACHQM5_003331 [Ranunculus cassubicifolius]